MIRLILKLVIAALIANAAWRVGSAYLSFYKFKDAVQETVQFTAAEKSDDQLRQRIVELAVEYAVPVTEDNFKLHREVEQGLVLDTELVENLMAAFAKHVGARIVVFVDAMAKAEQQFVVVLVLHVAQELLDAGFVADPREHPRN